MNIAVLGAGAWGTALAIALSRRHPVSLWTRDPSLVQSLLSQRENIRYLPTHRLPEAISVQPSLTAALADAELVIVGTASAGLAPTVERVLEVTNSLPLIWLCKGFIAAATAPEARPLLPHERVRAAQPNAPIGVLSGPSFAQEVASGLPVALTLASDDLVFAKRVASELSGGHLRVYASDDLVGVELGGALKNVMAIAAGIGDGLNLGMNARAALVTRGLAEMVRLGVAMGGRAETFMGLTGMGDLILTTTGHLSRNRQVGLAIAGGATLDQAIAQLGHVAEGVASAKASLSLARHFGVEMPITEAVNAILFAGANPASAVQQLLARDVRIESGSALT